MAQSPGRSHRLPEEVDGCDLKIQPRNFCAQRVEKVPVGAINDRPWILPKQNPSPQGENKDIFLRKIRKTAFFGGRSMIAPTSSKESMVSRQSVRAGATARVAPARVFPRRSEFHTPCPKVYKTAPKVDGGKRYQYRKWKIIAAKNMQCAQITRSKRGVWAQMT